MNEKMLNKEQEPKRLYGYDQGLLERGIKELIIDRQAAFSMTELRQILTDEFPGVPEDKIHIVRSDHGESLTISVEVD